MNINGETKLLGLIGSNIRHSKSFVLHNSTMLREGINGVYLPFQIQKKQFLSCMNGLASLNCIGVNITLPFKEEAFMLADKLSVEAESIQAINTLVRENNEWIGHNTDHHGFTQSLEENNIQLSGRPIFIWGAGGAAKSVCYTLKQKNISAVSCWNRTIERIKTLRPLIDVEYYDRQTALPEKAILINCVPSSQKIDYPQQLSFNPSHVVIDLSYWKTPLLQKAERCGATIIDGSGMLIHQAAKAFSLWFPASNPVQVMKNIYQETFQ